MRLALRLLPLALFLSCAAPRAAAPPAVAGEPRALLWEITRAGAPDHPLYLTGSIHMGRPDQFSLPPSLESAFARAGALVVELDPEATQPAALQGLVLELGIVRPPAPGLSQTLSAETRTALGPALARLGLTAAGVEQMRPWLLATTLSVLELRKAGYSDKAGIDLLLLRRARGTKRVIELETMQGQLAALAGLPDELQETMLREALQSAALTGSLLLKMAAAWDGGDAGALADLVYQSAQEPRYAAFYEALFYSRNRGMADKLAALLDGPAICLVAVGAGHVVGPQGIPSLLAQRGYLVRQLPRAAF